MSPVTVIGLESPAAVKSAAGLAPVPVFAVYAPTVYEMIVCPPSSAGALKLTIAP